MKYKIDLTTQEQATKLVAQANLLSTPIYLTDGSGNRVSARSLLGVLYATFDFTEVWLESENDYYFYFKEFIL